MAIWEVEADEAVYTVEGEDWMQVAIEVLRRVAPAAARCPSSAVAFCMNAASACAAGPCAWIFPACSRIAEISAAAACASTAPKYMASVNAYTCCMTAGGVLTRGSCFTVIGCE